MDQDLKFLLTLIAGAVGGAFIAGVFALVGAWVANKREHRQWLRNERLKAYAAYFTENRPWSVHSWLSTEIEFSKEAQAAVLQLQLVAPKKVLDATDKLGRHISNYRTHYERGAEQARLEGTEYVHDSEVLRHHIDVIADSTAELGHAMRKSLQLPRRESAHWVSLVTEDSPPDDEYRAELKEISQKRGRSSKQ